MRKRSIGFIILTITIFVASFIVWSAGLKPEKEEFFRLTIAKNSLTQKNYLYVADQGANLVMVYDIETMDFVRVNPDDPESDPIVYPVGESPTDVAYAHYWDSETKTYKDKVFVTCLNESQVDPCDSIYELDVQNLNASAQSFPTEDPGYCSATDIPLPTAIDFRADGKYGYVVKGYGGMRQDGGIIYVFDPSTGMAPLPPTPSIITLDPGTNPTRFDAGAYVDSDYVVYNIKTTITTAPATYFDVPAHQQALLSQVGTVETLLKSNANIKAILAKLDSVEKNAEKWVVNVPTLNKLVSLIESEKAVAVVERQ